MAQMAAKEAGPFEQLQTKWDEWYKKAPPALQVALIGLGGATQGGVLGGVMGSMAKAPGAEANPMLAAGAMTGGPLIMARNFAVLTGVNAGLSAAIKRYRGGVDDVKGAMAASFGSGVCFSLVSGMGSKPPPNMPPGQPAAGPLPTAIITGVTFALFNGLFYQIGQSFFGGGETEKGPAGEDRYLRTKYMLSNLGLSQYEKNFKKGQLDDATLMLVNESALRDCKIPPGPRLLIMHHLDGYRTILKPGAAFPMPPPPAEQ
uniref:SAM domain-containing protein n=1 Tax=Tetraselmis chuii TaxID=63592 RepID=A0A7S1SMT5_9CHLO|mmetsp:Transcript_20435/g.36450  ORF Transcript_20435/g.36450 Transcript_20435/m.36450 type:complete len:260 (+) Transcript_20435:134-913(+)|eukprot:CAMPEP_0177775652 /NCGR_PEP_ID=MMETSP0491_2-20121128/14241_1 /TAXON_ID=63592 /ORGANISM="Tetraselmis chuii, Strain PLY429" /LENGTH=259 /DNA_ID=CAMNT_0019294285 /DNA_START=131 /DNA_END=910 /DNA_ORIENTATION=+